MSGAGELMATSMVTADWVYAGFEEAETLSERIEQCAKHLTEVRRAAMEQGTGKGRYNRLPANYVPDLQKRLEAMRTQLSEQTAAAAAVAATCGRPVSLRPRF